MGHDHAHHDHDHGHDHDHAGHSHGLPRASNDPAQRARDRRRLVFVVGITSILFVCELVGGLYAHSLALVSESGHMLSDIFAQGLALGAIMLAARPADARRTFGWQRVEILAALANGILLGLLSGALMWQAYRRFGEHVEIHTGVMMGIAAVGLVANLVGAGLLHGAKNLNVRGAYLHVVSDTVSSAAVLIGGAVMYFVKGLYFVDAVVSICIGVFVLWGAVRLVRDAVDILLETVPKELDRERVCTAIRKVDGVIAIHDVHIWSITSGQHALSAHVVVRVEGDVKQDELLRRLHEVLQRDFKLEHSTLQLEPMGFDHVGTAVCSA